MQNLNKYFWSFRAEGCWFLSFTISMWNYIGRFAPKEMASCSKRGPRSPWVWVIEAWNLRVNVVAGGCVWLLTGESCLQLPCVFCVCLHAGTRKAVVGTLATGIHVVLRVPRFPGRPRSRRPPGASLGQLLFPPVICLLCWSFFLGQFCFWSYVIHASWLSSSCA